MRTMSAAKTIRLVCEKPIFATGRLVVVTLLAIGFSILAVTLIIFREPTFRGRTLSSWLGMLYGDTDSRTEAAHAVHEIGERSMPIIVDWLDQRGSPFKQHMAKVIYYISAGKWSWRPVDNYTKRQEALEACDILGPMAKKAIPTLKGLLGKGYLDYKSVF
jgi:hypothetical protein